MNAYAIILGGLTLTGGLIYWQGQRNGRPERPPHRDPHLEVFDADDDNAIAYSEIEAVVADLRQRDRDGDGVLRGGELPPPAPRRARSSESDQPSRANDPQRASAVTDGEVVLRGGFDTDPRDRGRPVRLIAAALGVEAQVFRDAFSNVQPSRLGPPTASRARMNKDVLMKALAKHGISNDRLDEVSNYYRYQPGSGNLWRHKAASAKAIIEEGRITRIEILEAGSGYMNEPSVQVAGHPGVKLKVTLAYTKDFHTNGSIKSIELLE